MKTKFKRRTFLVHLAVLGAAGGLSAWAHTRPAFVPAIQRKEVMLHQLALSDFMPHLNSRFTLELETGRRLEMKLAEAVAVGAAAGPRPAGLAPRTPFSIVFQAPWDPHLTQRTYRVHHEHLGDFDLFLVPIGRDARGLKCEAIFN